MKTFGRDQQQAADERGRKLHQSILSTRWPAQLLLEGPARGRSPATLQHEGSFVAWRGWGTVTVSD
jgi:hypothetical protein